MDVIDRATTRVGLMVGFLAMLNCQILPAQASPAVSSGSMAGFNTATEANPGAAYGKLLSTSRLTMVRPTPK